MKIKVIEAEGYVLDWLVAKCLGFGLDLAPDGYYTFKPSTDYAYGGPIMEREKFCAPLWYRFGEQWVASHPKNAALGILGPTQLIAAMRCYVISKLGEEVEVPDDLMEV